MKSMMSWSSPTPMNRLSPRLEQMYRPLKNTDVVSHGLTVFNVSGSWFARTRAPAILPGMVRGMVVRGMMRKWGLLLAVAVSWSGVHSAEAASRHSQRMVLAPACYSIAPGASYDASAYCLDKSLPAPAAGEVLASAPFGFGDTRIKAGATSAVTLQEALAAHLIRIEGLGRDDYDHVRILNLSGQTLGICSTEPSIVAGDADAPTKDLAPLYPTIRSLAKETPDPASHAALQEKLWQTVDDQDFEAWWRTLTQPGDTAPQKGKSTARLQADCLSGARSVKTPEGVMTYCPNP
jgi:hypothetical protein